MEIGQLSRRSVTTEPPLLRKQENTEQQPNTSSLEPAYNVEISDQAMEISEQHRQLKKLNEKFDVTKIPEEAISHVMTTYNFQGKLA